MRKTGHIGKVCRSSTPRREKPTFKTKHLTPHLSDPATTADDVDNLGLFTLHTGRKAPISINLQINNKPVSFQLDTGAALSLMTEKDFHTFFQVRASSGIHKCTTDVHWAISQCARRVCNRGRSQWSTTKAAFSRRYRKWPSFDGTQLGGKDPA
ncbi:hypothetical protein RRG08_051292 [Elysia crispata]|uniref:Peptidase A2 domain-containing protein n=1 Tax=Elysia crispata TaxID=231223 RepID=A0AAE0XS60_9GAST|nr:hypothetical protein RRG08_051292 [Elysia crispata]